MVHKLDTPYVLLSRFHDDIYIILLTMCGLAGVAASALIHAMYGVPLKWEPEDLVTLRCKCESK